MKRIFSLFALLSLFPCFSSDKNWIELYIRVNSSCSSELNAVDPFEGLGPYGPHNLFDNNPATAWVEGVKGYGSGQYFFAGLGYSLPEKIGIRNGYQKSEIIYKKNSRVKSARVSLFAGFFLSGDVTEIASMYRVKQIGIESVVVLRDVMGLQDIALPVNKEVAFNERVNLTRQFKNEFRERIDMIKKDNPDCINPVSFQYFLKFEIIDVYPGSSWDDTCISDMLPRDMTTDPVSGDEIIRRVYVAEEKSKVLFDTDIRSEMVLVDMKKLKEYRETGQGVSMAITLMDVSKDNEWAQVDFMFSAIGARVEEYPVLYQVRSGRRVESDILNNPGGMTGFSEKNGKIFLDTDKGPVDLEVIKKKLINKH